MHELKLLDDREGLFSLSLAITSSFYIITLGEVSSDPSIRLFCIMGSDNGKPNHSWPI